MTLDEAIETVARMAFTNEGAEPSWEDYPDITEQDWYRVRDRVAELAAAFRAETGDYGQAYRMLAERAEGAPA